MKNTSTTRVLTRNGLAARSVLVLVSVLMAIAGPIAIMPKAKASGHWDGQISALQQQADQYQAQASQLRQQADTLENKLSDLRAQKASVEAELQISQAQYDKLVDEIKQTEKKIADNQDVLGSTIADLYVDDTISPLEMLASSDNIGDYVDKQTYRTSVQDQLTETIKTIKELKTKLENDKKAVQAVIDKQTAQRNTLTSIENEQQNLLEQTRGQEAAYQQQVASTKAQMAAIHAEQQAALAALLRRSGSNNAGAVGAFEFRNWSGNQGCGGGYPYCGAGKDTAVDPWGLYNRECVSWSAYRATQMGKQIGYFSGQGNAYQWPSSAPGWMGAVVNNTPAVGAVAILPITPGFAPIGHSMNVEAVLGDGWVRVSQFNFGGTGEFSTMEIKASGVVFVHFPNR